MDLKRLTDDLIVSGQIEPEDMETLAGAGVHIVICNRPDGEEDGQPSFDEIASAAARHGIRALYIPVSTAGITDVDVAGFRNALATAQNQKPALAYCRSGTRSTALWALSKAGEVPADDILETAAQAGYNLQGLMPRLS